MLNQSTPTTKSHGTISDFSSQGHKRCSTAASCAQFDTSCVSLNQSSWVIIWIQQKSKKQTKTKIHQIIAILYKIHVCCSNLLKWLANDHWQKFVTGSQSLTSHGPYYPVSPHWTFVWVFYVPLLHMSIMTCVLSTPVTPEDTHQWTDHNRSLQFSVCQLFLMSTSSSHF